MFFHQEYWPHLGGATTKQESNKRNIYIAAFIVFLRLIRIVSTNDHVVRDILDYNHGQSWQ